MKKMLMIIFSFIFVATLIMIASVKAEDTAKVFDTTNCWPLTIGNWWKFVKEDEPEKTLLIIYIPFQTPQPTLVFIKSHPDMWPCYGNDLTFILFTRWIGDYLVLSHDDKVQEESPESPWTMDQIDCIYYTLDFSRWLNVSHYISETEFPPFYMWFPRYLPSEIHYAVYGNYKCTDPSWQVYPTFPGRLDYYYEIISTPVSPMELHLEINEDYSHGTVYEDYYWTDGIGPTKIESWEDVGRSKLQVRMILESFHISEKIN